MDDMGKMIRESDKIAGDLKAIAHELRLLTICRIGEKECTVNELERYLGTSQSNVSQHLSKMKMRGILSSRKVGNQVYYKVKNPKLLELLKVVQDVFA